MNIKDIRKMSDKELNAFLVDIQRYDRKVCASCGEFVFDKTVLSVRKGQVTRVLCTLCNECYINLLDHLGINDAEF